MVRTTVSFPARPRRGLLIAAFGRPEATRKAPSAGRFRLFRTPAETGPGPYPGDWPEPTGPLVGIGTPRSKLIAEQNVVEIEGSIARQQAALDQLVRERDGHAKREADLARSAPGVSRPSFDLPGPPRA